MQLVDEIWRLVPPEEKLAMMAKAQSKGVQSVLTVLLVAGSISIGLQVPQLIWCSLLFAPLIFQFVAGKQWRGLKPRVMLDYLAVRSVVRRYAYSLKASDLHVHIIFRGYLSEEAEDEKIRDALSAIESSSRKVEFWIALLDSAVVVVSEGAGGARLNFGCVIDENLAVDGISLDDKEYSNSREVLLKIDSPKYAGRIYKLSSDYPVALNAFERKLLELQHYHVNKKAEERKLLGIEIPDT